MQHLEEMSRENDVVDARLQTKALLQESAPVLEDLTEQLEMARRLLNKLDEAAEGMT